MSESNSGSDVVSMKMTARKEGELWPFASDFLRPKCFVIHFGNLIQTLVILLYYFMAHFMVIWLEIKY